MGVSLTNVCLGHVLVKIHESMIYVEEFEFFLASQMDPLFEQSVETLTKSDPDLRNWVALYRPIVHYLQASYRNLLQQRQLRLGQQLVASTKALGDSGAASDVQQLPYVLAQMAQTQFQLADVGLSGMIVEPKVFDTTSAPEVATIPARYEALHRVADTFRVNHEAR